MPAEPRVIRSPLADVDRSLGHLAVAWMEYFTVHGPGDVQGDPAKVTDEFYDFIVDCYVVDLDGKLLHDSAFLSRPKGCDKSGIAARLALFEALGPCRATGGFAHGGEVYRDPWGLGFEYPYPPGEPIAQHVRVPFIRCMATEEGQTGNVYDTIHYNLSDSECLLSQVPGIDPGITRTNLPGGGEITPSTASSASKDGGKETFVVFDESHLLVTPELRRMYKTVTRNLRKRKKIAGTWFIETTTMFAPGDDSIAELTYKLAGAIEEGKAKRERLLFNHRWGECDDLADEALLRRALYDAYGDAAAWNDIDAIVGEFYDPRAESADSRRYFLNAPTSAADAWLAQYEWAARADATKVVSPSDPVTLGFDGSRRRARGVTDATALVGCRVSDGHIFVIATWEQPTGLAGEDWEVPTTEVDAAVRGAFEKYRVVGFFADPARWESYVAGWEAAFGSKLLVKSMQTHPIEWWMTGGRSMYTVRALDKFHSAVIDGEMTHDGSFVLTRHVLNARRRPSRSGMQIGKEHPDSERKIDTAVAAVLAYTARIQAVAAGVGVQRAGGFVPRRLA